MSYSAIYSIAIGLLYSYTIDFGLKTSLSYDKVVGDEFENIIGQNIICIGCAPKNEKVNKVKNILFITEFLVGVCSILLGYYLMFSKDTTLPFDNDSVGTGLALGGIFLMINGSVINWINISNGMKFLIVGFSLLLLIYGSGSNVIRNKLLSSA